MKSKIKYENQVRILEIGDYKTLLQKIVQKFQELKQYKFKLTYQDGQQHINIDEDNDLDIFKEMFGDNKMGCILIKVTQKVAKQPLSNNKDHNLSQQSSSSQRQKQQQQQIKKQNSKISNNPSLSQSNQHVQTGLNSKSKQQNKYSSILNRNSQSNQKMKVPNEISKQTIQELIQNKIQQLINKIQNKMQKLVKNMTQSSYSNLLHQGYQCSSCAMLPIRGLRFVDNNMNYFNLCQYCKQEKFNQRHMTCIRFHTNRLYDKPTL